MAKTYSQLLKEIAKLQREADAARALEVGGVVGRIKDAIVHYGLTPQDLFGQTPAAVAKPAKLEKLAEVAAVATRIANNATAKKPSQKRPSAPRFRDEAGNTWTGNGQRPGWFKAAIESGKTREDLEIKH